MTKHLISILLLLSVSFTSFGQTPFNDVYLKKLDNWQRNMTRWKLRNFVPLVGLHLLKEGENSFGKSIENDIVVNSDNAPDIIGTIIKSGTVVSFESAPEIEVTISGKKVESIDYTFDGDRNSEKLRKDFVYWYIQYVEEDFFLRIIDDQSPLVSSYQPFDYYKGNPDFILQGKYKEFKKPKTIALDNVIATSQKHTFTGEVMFKYQGKRYNLLVLDGSFLMFTDETNGDTTFPYGRYLRLNIQEDNSVEVDFNYSFSPPRSVSLYTTCEIPPENNHLPFEVEAGEMYDSTGEEIIRAVH